MFLFEFFYKKSYKFLCVFIIIVMIFSLNYYFLSDFMIFADIKSNNNMERVFLYNNYYDRHSYPLYVYNYYNLKGVYLNFTKIELLYHLIKYKSYFFVYSWQSFVYNNILFKPIFFFKNYFPYKTIYNYENYMLYFYPKYYKNMFYFYKLNFYEFYEFKFRFYYFLDYYTAITNKTYFYFSFLEIFNLKYPTLNEAFGSNLFFNNNNNLLLNKEYFYFYGFIIFNLLFKLFVLNLNFIFYFVLFFIIFYLCMYLFILNFYFTKKLGYLGLFFHIYIDDTDDVFPTLITYKQILQELFRYDKYYNILKYEKNYLNYQMTFNKNNFFWYNRSKNLLSKGQELSLKYSLNSLFLTKIEMGLWHFEESSQIDEWSYFPYDLLLVSFPEYDYYLKYFNKKMIMIYDEAYDDFAFLDTDIYGTYSYNYKFHPFWSNDYELNGIYNFESKTYDSKKYVKKLDEEVFFKLSNRYKELYLTYFKKVKELEKIVDYNGTLNNYLELSSRSLDTSLNLTIYENRLYQLSVSFFVFYDDEDDGSDFLGFIDTKDLRYKLVPSVWRNFSKINFYSIIVQTSLLHFFIRRPFFLEEIGHTPDSIVLEEELLFFNSDLKTSKLFSNFEKSLSFLNGFGFGRRVNDDSLIKNNFLAYENLEFKKYIKYPIYSSFIGYFLINLEYRLKNKYLYKDKHIYLFFQNSSFDIRSMNTYFIGYNEYPVGLSFSTKIMDDKNYKNSDKLISESFELEEEIDNDYRIFYNEFMHIIEVSFFSFVLPISIVCFTILSKII